MATFVRRSQMPVPVADLADWHFRPGAFERLCPPWDGVHLAATTGPLANGSRWTIRAPLGPFNFDWVAELFDVRPGEQFRDRMLKGPFARWQHTHRFLPAGASSILEEDIEYRLPLGVAGRLAGGWKARRELDRMFAYRHAVTRRDLLRHAAFRDSPRRTVVVTGSRGLIGRELVPFLTAGGHRVIRLVTGANPTPAYADGTTWLPWEPMSPLDPSLIAGADAIIHLAAEPIAVGKWTTGKRDRMLVSRTIPTRHLAEAAATAGVRDFLCASAVGIYGDRGDEELTEEASPGTGFIADLCRQWEAAAVGGRAAHLRIGVVLSPRGAALGRQLTAYRFGLGAVFGSGRQFLPWVGIDDTVAAIHHTLMTPSLTGPVNVTAPHPVPQREFARTLARVLRRPLLFTAPAWSLRLLMGEVANPALLASMNAVPGKLLASGFTFDGPELVAELRYLLGL